MIKHFSIDPYRIAKHCLRRYIEEMRWEKLDDIVINVQEIYDSVIYPDYEVLLKNNYDLGYNINGIKILGKTLIGDENVIMIDRSIRPDDHEYAFTLAHEIGHALIHNERDIHLECTKESIFNEHYLNELHVDCFAEHLIMPHSILGYRFVQCYGTWSAFTYNGPGNYAINGGNIGISALETLYQKLAEPLTPFFSNVSKKILARTMQQLRLIDDQTVVPIVSEKRGNFLIKGSMLYNFAMDFNKE